MTLFILGLAVFFAAHSFTAFFRAQRDSLIGKIGFGPYRGLFSVVTLAGLTLIVMGWPNADASPLYNPPAFFRHATYILVPISLILFVGSLSLSGPIIAAVKHPLLAGLKIWAFAHLIANGEVRSVLLFGAFLLFAVADRIAVKRRGAPEAKKGPLRNDLIAVAIGLGLSALIFFYLHQFLGGVRLF